MNKNKSYFIAIDAGTGSGRVVVFDELGHQIAFSQREWRHLNLTGVPGAIDFDVEVNWNIIKELIKEAISLSGISSKDIRAVTSTSMREGLVLYDRTGREIWACSNIDARAEEEVVFLKKQGFEEEIYQRTGQAFSISDVPRLLWVKNNLPHVYEKIHTIGMISDWVIYKLSGEFRVEPSNVSTSGFFDTMNRSWSEDLLNKVDLPKSVYPQVVEPGTSVGTIEKNVAEEVGFSPDTQIVMGGGDAQLGCIGVGAVREFDTVILGGTFWQQEVNVKEPVPHPEGKIRINSHAVPGLWQFEGISFLIGLVMRWFRDAFCQIEKRMAQDLNISAYAILSEQAKSVPPGAYGIMPIFSDVMNYMHWKHAAPSLLNFDINEPEKYGKPAVFRALMENAGFNCLGNLLEIGKAVKFYPEQVIFAGGASNSPEWSKIIANVLGASVKVPKIKEATALGGFICAAIGVGRYSSFEEAVQSVVRSEATYVPDPEEHKIYLDLYEKWKKAYSVMLNLSDSGLLKYMWKAPGL
jgi:autoinducer 2 (AI-2) kinase